LMWVKHSTVKLHTSTYFHFRRWRMCQPRLSTWKHMQWPREQIHMHVCRRIRGNSLWN